MLWLNGLLSASFSVPRCSRPICGSARWMTSPSISSTRRSTPWAAGCWGPKLMVMFWISGIADHPRHQHAVLDGHGLIYHPLLVGVVTDLHIAFQREILAEWMADETVIRQDPPQIGMPFEQDAEE